MENLKPHFIFDIIFIYCYSVGFRYKRQMNRITNRNVTHGYVQESVDLLKINILVT